MYLDRRWTLPVLALLTLAACAGGTEPGGTAEEDVAGDVADTSLVPDTSDTSETDTADTSTESDTSETDVEEDGDGGPPPGTLGAPCQDDDECDSGYCVASDEGRVCASFCTDTCPDGYECRLIVNSGADAVELCLPIQEVLCLACSIDSQCGGLDDYCLEIGGEDRCGRECEAGSCPEGYSCATVEAPSTGEIVDQCVPDIGTCSNCLDLDGDTFGEGEACASVDCDDLDPTTFPGAAELCDGYDNDCDEEIDEDYDLTSDPLHCGACGVVCEADNATMGCEESACVVTACADGFYDVDGEPENGCEATCAPTNGGEEIVDGIDNDCNDLIDDHTTAYDDDGDGYCELGPCVEGILGDGDCDDTQASTAPGAPEDGGAGTQLGDGINNDCDGQIDEGMLDVDDDGDGYCDFESCRDDAAPDDCDDLRASVYPGAEELANGVDDDCDGTVDEGTSLGDDDGDGFSESEGDCDDADRFVHPDAMERPNGADDNCNGFADEGTILYDDDGDGYCEGPAACTFGRAPGDCNDAEAATSPDTPEAVNGADDNCDGRIDDGTSVYDDDGDGYCEIAPCVFGVTGGDCDDTNAERFPDARETRNGVDDDCDIAVDEETTAYDDDGDGYCEIGPCVVGAAGAGDCDDGRTTVHPGAAEDGGTGTNAGDGLDNDCDVTVDEGTTAYDDDGDGYCEIAPCVYGALGGGDCDDVRADRHPFAAELSDGVDNNCNGETDEGTTLGDDDGDGFNEASGDCDDTNPDIYPGAPELPNRIDDNCNTVADEGTILFDDDGDSYCEGPGTCTQGTAPGDCDDTRASVSPGRAEVLNGTDDDCDGRIDDGTVVYDDDGDGYCEFGPCEFGSAGGDCDDTSAAIHPGASETRNGEDDNCNSQVDEGTTAYDDDGDGYCEVGPCVIGARGEGDCNDESVVIYPTAPEDGGDGSDRSDGLDNDCDGDTDELMLDVDDDGDGFCEEAPCVGGGPDGDCDDTAILVNPDAEEVSDGIDNDCDGIADNGTDLTDDDGDGFNEISGDCDDDNDRVYPGAPEDGGTGTGEPDGIDNDCDGITDNGTDASDDDGDGFCETAPCADPGVLGGDCHDGNPNIHPARDEVCGNSIDDDCDGTTDIVDNDRDGHEDVECGGDDCDDADGTTYPGATELRDGRDNDCDADGIADEGLISAGDIVITEVMANPDAVDDATGEWIELYNATDTPINLRGWHISDNAATDVVSGDVMVPSQRYVTLGRSALLASNGGVPHAYVFNGLFLSNSADNVTLAFGGTTITRVSWGTITVGASRQLSSRRLSSGTPDWNSDMCISPTGITYGAGDRGTPGGPNIDCDSSAPTIGWLTPVESDPTPVTSGVAGGGERFQIIGTRFTSGATVTINGAAAAATYVDDFTLEVVTPPGTPGDATVAVTTSAGSHSRDDVFRYFTSASGITSCQLLHPLSEEGLQATQTRPYIGAVTSSATGPDGRAPGVVGQVGYAAPGIHPEDAAGWRWYDATYVFDNGSADAYSRRLTVNPTGTYATAYRFSTDGGASWRFCDADGGVFSLDAAGTLVIR